MISIKRVVDPESQRELRSFIKDAIEAGDFSKRYDQNNTLMHLVFGVSYLWRSHENTTRVLLEFFWKCLPESDMNAQNDQGRTPLMYLLSYDWNNTNRIDQENIETAIATAAKRSDPDIADSLGNTAVFYIANAVKLNQYGVAITLFPDIDWFATNDAGDAFFEISPHPDVRWEGQKRLNRKLQDRIRVLESAQ